MFKNRSIVIFGGSGSWGKELIKQLLEKDVKEIRVFSRNEFLQVQTEREFNNPKLKFILGDIRDYKAVLKASKNTDYVINLAAYKHVPLGEIHASEFIKTNIYGLQNVIEAAIENGVKRVVYSSTDKACLPINLYGMTKGIGEKLISQANKENENTLFSVIRSGNVLGSQGSVVPLFINQIKKYNKITLTNGEMTRYYLTLDEAIKLLLTTFEFHFPENLFVTKMPSCKIIDLAEVLIEYYGNKATIIEEIGEKQGEKTHESLVSKYEAPNAYEYGDRYYIISKTSLSLPKVSFKEYASNSQKLMSKDEIKILLKKGGFLENL